MFKFSELDNVFLVFSVCETVAGLVDGGLMVF